MLSAMKKFIRSETDIKFGGMRARSTFFEWRIDMVITNVNIFMPDGTFMKNAFVRFCDGKITEVGFMPTKISGEETFDGENANLYPGFIDAHTHLGMWEDSLTFEGDDGNEETDPCTPQLRAIDSVNPMDKCFGEAADAGITTVLTGPGSANALGGQFTAIKTVGVRIDNMIVKECASVKMALGENPKSVYHGKNETPITRMATVGIIREQLYKAKRYMEEIDRAKDADELPEYDIKCEALIPALKREIPVHIHAHRADDIFTAIRIAKEFNLVYTLIHATSAHEVVDELSGEQDMNILCGPILCDRSKPELKALTPASPAVLYKAGFDIALITDHPVIPIQYLPLCAGLAVREGLPHSEAIKAITSNPAKICGIYDRVGSVEVGKDADFVLFDCDPLSVYAKPKAVFADGKRVR